MVEVVVVAETVKMVARVGLEMVGIAAVVLAEAVARLARAALAVEGREVLGTTVAVGGGMVAVRSIRCSSCTRQTNI